MTATPVPAGSRARAGPTSWVQGGLCGGARCSHLLSPSLGPGQSVLQRHQRPLGSWQAQGVFYAGALCRHTYLLPTRVP